MTTAQLRGAVLDMDGVITKTASIHARAWKEMFDEYFERLADQMDKPPAPFSIEGDYRKYVDGKPRYAGVKSFLKSRGVELPFGKPSDEAGTETICGLGNWKNELFHKLLGEGTVEVFEDTLDQMRRWKEAGWKLAAISASRNCRAVLKAAGVVELFDAIVDGNDIAELGIPGKPDPDMLLHAAKLIETVPAQTVVVEDAIAGIEAARQGDFGLLVGVVRDGNDRELKRAGAHRVVRDLRQWDRQTDRPDDAPQHKSVAETARYIASLTGGTGSRQLALFLDYDGTLTPIVRRPEDAILPAAMRSLLRDLADRFLVSLVSGRDRRQLEELVQLPNVVYAGSHGFDITGPGDIRWEQKEATCALPDLEQAEQLLQQGLKSIAGARVERKRFAVAVHYRETPASQVDTVEREVDRVAQQFSRLRKRGGKKIFELQPDVSWDKGRAILWLIDALSLDRHSTAVVYIGDDETDEDAFRAISDHNLGIGIRVGEPADHTRAHRCFRSCEDVRHFFELLLESVPPQADTDRG